LASLQSFLSYPYIWDKVGNKMESFWRPKLDVLDRKPYTVRIPRKVARYRRLRPVIGQKKRPANARRFILLHAQNSPYTIQYIDAVFQVRIK